MCFSAFDIVLAGAERRNEHKCLSIYGRRHKTKRTKERESLFKLVKSKHYGENNIMYFAEVSPH